MKRRRSWTVLLLALAVVVVLLPARAGANGMPILWLYLNTGDNQALLPDRSDQIAILSEHLTYAISHQSDSAQADVCARYTMQNTSGVSVEQHVAFVSSNAMRTPEVTFRGERVQVQEVRTLSLDPSLAPLPEQVDVDEVQERLDTGLFDDIPFESVLKWMSESESVNLDAVPFDTPSERTIQVTLYTLVFEAEEICEMVVSYPEAAASLSANKDIDGTGRATMQFCYYLEPVRYWKEFHDLTIEVEVERAKVSFNQPGFKRKGSTYTAHFDEQPDGNLLIEVVHKKGISAESLRVLPNALSAIAGCMLLILAGILLKRSIQRI